MILLRTLSLALLLMPAASAQCVTGGIAVVVNKTNTIETLSAAQLKKVMLGDLRNWPDHKSVIIVNREPGAVFTCLLTAVLHMSSADYRKYLMGAEFRGQEGAPVKSAVSAADAVKTVATAAGGITLVDGHLIPQLPGTVKLVKIDGKIPGDAGYPF